MLRFVVSGVMLLALVPSIAVSQDTSPGFGARFKSLFTREEKPAPPPPKRKPQPPAKLPAQSPQQVTTRSGSLRQAGNQHFAPITETKQPTFVPEEVKLESLAPRPISPAGASELPRTLPPKRPAIRDQHFQTASHETPPEKKTMVSWWKGLWSKESKSPPAPAYQPAPQMEPSAANGGEEGSSIDPRRVYRGPQSTPPTPNGARGTGFSETGVPQSTNEFRGRKDSRF